jgi:hypothetical protein
MPLLINGTPAERAIIEGWLQEICWRIRVHPNTGGVSVIAGPPRAGAHETGWLCLEEIIRDHRTVTIQPLPGPAVPVPGTGTLIRQWGGGLTTRPAGSEVQGDGQPGNGPDGNPALAHFWW